MTEAVGALGPGVTVGRYRVDALLGEGGMGTVWRATHLGLRKQVVIKVLRRDFAAYAEARARFLREGEAAARVRHPHVVEVHDVGLHGDLPFLVMEHLDGEDLAARIVRERTISMPELADLMLPVCAGVSAAHEEGVVHRDLKPENIFLARDRDGVLVPKVLDFGISRVVDDDSGRVRTATAVILGTPAYMSPEQARGERVIDDRSDQYALGVILYECATGSLPVPLGAPYEMLARVVAGRFPRPRAVQPGLDAGFEAVVLRAMALSKEQRFPSARALGGALLPFAGPRARARWGPTLGGAEGPARRATHTLDEGLTADPRFVVPPREGPNDTLLDEGPREATTLPLPPPRRRWRAWAVGAGAGVAVVGLAALVAWALRS